MTGPTRIPQMRTDSRVCHPKPTEHLVVGPESTVTRANGLVVTYTGNRQSPRRSIVVGEVWVAEVVQKPGAGWVPGDGPVGAGCTVAEIEAVREALSDFHLVAPSQSEKLALLLIHRRLSKLLR